MDVQNSTETNNLKIKSHIWSIFTSKTFLLMWLAQSITQIGMNMLTFILGIFIYQKTKLNTNVSLLYLTVALPAAVFGILSGVYVDKYNKKRVLIISTFVRVILLLLIILLHKELFWVYIITALISIAGQFFVPAQAALIPRFVKKDLLLSANSLFTLTFYGALIGGYVAGGPLLQIFGGYRILWVLVSLFSLSTLFLLFIPASSEDHEIKHTLTVKHVIADMWSVLDYIKKTAIIKQAILLMTLSQVIISIFMTLGPGFADRILEIDVRDASVLILGPAALGLIVGAIWMGNFGMKFRKKQLINLGIYFSGFLFLFLSLLILIKDTNTLSDIYYLIVGKSIMANLLQITTVSFFCLGFANSLIDISCNTVLQENSQNEMRGRVYGVLATLISGVALLPVVISGLLADVVGIGKIIFLMGLGLTIFGIQLNHK